MNVSLIIPAYLVNGELVHTTSRCILSLRGEKPDEVILVNDGSPTGFDSSALEPLYSGGLLDKRINRPVNGGYIAAINDGLAAATGDILVLGNNDLVFKKGWVKALTSLLDDGYDISTVWTSDQKVTLIDEVEDNAKFGSLFAMTRKVYETLGGFDPQFRDYFGDLDYRRRALDMGFKIGKNLNFVVQHGAKATYKQVDPNDERYERGMRLYEAKYGFVE